MKTEHKFFIYNWIILFKVLISIYLYIYRYKCIYVDMISARCIKQCYIQNIEVFVRCCANSCWFSHHWKSDAKPGQNQDLARKMGVKKRRRKGRSARGSYCWWLKSCTTWDVWNPINNGIIIILGGAGFQPSTVSLLNVVTQGVTLIGRSNQQGFLGNFWRYTPAKKGWEYIFAWMCFLKDMTYSWIL